MSIALTRGLCSSRSVICVIRFPSLPVSLFFSVSRYAAFISKLLPPSGHALLDWVRADRFYCFLLPLGALPTYLILYLNWLSMRIFEGS